MAWSGIVYLFELCRLGVALPRVDGDQLVGGAGVLERHHGDAAWWRLGWNGRISGSWLSMTVSN